MYNMDEKGFIIGYSAKAKVICCARRRNPRVTQDGKREMLTVVECCGAGMVMLPSFVTYKGSAHCMGWHSQTNDPKAVFTSSDNGWMDNELALEWIKHFDKHSRWHAGRDTRIIFLDGHGSHLTLEFCQHASAIDNNIVLFCFPPHSTHLMPDYLGLYRSIMERLQMTICAIPELG
jgi:hypothetical protein